MSIMVKRKSNRQIQKKKSTCQGGGKYTRKTHSGGETYYGNIRAGSPPSKIHRRKKQYRGQG